MEQFWENLRTFKTILAATSLSLLLGIGVAMLLGLPDQAGGALGVVVFGAGIFLYGRFVPAPPERTDPVEPGLLDRLHGLRHWLLKGVVVTGFVGLMVVTGMAGKSLGAPYWVLGEVVLVEFALYLAVLETLEPSHAESPTGAGSISTPAA